MPRLVELLLLKDHQRAVKLMDTGNQMTSLVRIRGSHLYQGILSSLY